MYSNSPSNGSTVKLYGLGVLPTAARFVAVASRKLASSSIVTNPNENDIVRSFGNNAVGARGGDLDITAVLNHVALKGGVLRAPDAVVLDGTRGLSTASSQADCAIARC